MTTKPTVAIVGSGISGLSAAYVLRSTHSVTLFESDTRVGGHAHTLDVSFANGLSVPIDSGFIVHNEATYPNLLRIFDELDIPTQETEMSMSVTCRGCGLEFAGSRGLRGVFAQRSRLFSLRYLRLLAEIPKFHRRARSVLAKGVADNLTWGEFLDQGRFSQYFINHFAVPLVACVWSSAATDTRQYPAAHLFTFLDNHGLLRVSGSPTWKTVTGGSRVYVQRLVAELGEAIVHSEVTSVSRGRDAVSLTFADGSSQSFDQVVIATHADDALRLLVDATDDEGKNLASFKYSVNTTLLHRDPSVLPSNPGARASWNYQMESCTATADSVLVSYWMNNLHRLTLPDDVSVTLNPGNSVNTEAVIAEMSYSHPIFTYEAVAAAQVIRRSGGQRLAFAGAHLGWGFHEDGCRSGVEAAQRLGGSW